MAFKVGLILSLIFFSQVAFVARFPDLVHKSLKVSPDLVWDVLKVLGNDRKFFECTLADNMETASVVAQKGSFTFSVDQKPHLKNTVSISQDLKSIVLGPHWLDYATGHPKVKVPRYGFSSKDFKDDLSDRSDCWVRINQYLLSIGKNELRFEEKSSGLLGFVSAPQVLLLKRSNREGNTSIQLFLGPEVSD